MDNHPQNLRPAEDAAMSLAKGLKAMDLALMELPATEQRDNLQMALEESKMGFKQAQER